jgi:lauroyl/myristoyl acyltransferase
MDVNRRALDLTAPIERRLRRYLTERNRIRLDRAKRFVEEAQRRPAGDEIAHRVFARWLKFLCSRTPVQRDICARDADFLRHFATLFGLPPGERREFVGLSLMGSYWRASRFQELLQGPTEWLARLTRVTGWEHFERCRGDPAGLILLPVHTQFSRLSILYLRHLGHEGVSVGLPGYELEMMGLRTPVAKRFELARQMHSAKHLLSRGGIVFNVPDALQNLDNSRSVEFFGRHRRLATGFAELTLKTGAHVVPIAHRFSPRGFFVLEFGAPFHVLGPQSTPDERIDSLVGQYANFLRDEWRRYPWNIQWNHLRHHCELPNVDPDSSGENAHGELSRRAQALPQ